MTITHTFDDPHAYARRWGHKTREQVSQLSQADPLLFLADHISVTDRRVGALAFMVDLGMDRPPTMILVKDGPEDPDVDECLTMLINVVQRADSEFGPGALDVDRGETHVQRLGVVAHRTGAPSIQQRDRAWAQALDGAARWFDLEPVGVVVRTATGAIVRVPPTPYAIAG